MIQETEGSDQPELPSWASGQTKDAILEFLEASAGVAVEDKIAVFDNDGTLWVERPHYVQDAFIRSAVADRRKQDPAFRLPEGAERLLAEGTAALHDLAVDQVAAELNLLFAGLTPDQFHATATDFVNNSRNTALDRPHLALRYQPMLELLHALERRDFTNFIVTGGGTEFVRSFCHRGYGVPGDRVIGTSLVYAVTRTETGTDLHRTEYLDGEPNEGEEKVRKIQRSIGRRPIFAAGNTAGDSDMLDYVASGSTPALSLLVSHDDADREFAYRGEAATFVDHASLDDRAASGGWQVVSIKNDWRSVFSVGDSERLG